MIKISFIARKTGKVVNVNYSSGITEKRKKKSFPNTPVGLKTALDFILTLPETYIHSIPDELFNNAVDADHAILTKKNFELA